MDQAYTYVTVTMARNRDHINGTGAELGRISPNLETILMISLVSLNFNGFRSSEGQARVNFSSKPISVIYGPNGSGKTTFLRAINAFLVQDGIYLESIAVRDIECHYIIDQQPKCIRVTKVEAGYDWSELNNSELASTKSISLGIERGATTQQLRVEPDLIFSFFTHPRYREMFSSGRPGIASSQFRDLSMELSQFIRMRQSASSRIRRSELDFSNDHVNLQNIKLENIESLMLEHYSTAKKTATLKIQNALFDTLAIAIDQEYDNTLDITFTNFSEDLKNSRTRLLEALVGEDSNKFKNMIIGKLKGLTDDIGFGYEDAYKNKMLRALFINMIAELKMERLLLNSINLLVDKFNHFLINGKKLKITDTQILIDISGKVHGINSLSSGERHILTFLVLVLFEGSKRDFMIIDEPEISLNIAWQRELLSLFHELIPNTQIIVASHSPVLSKRNPGYLVELQSSVGV